MWFLIDFFGYLCLLALPGTRLAHRGHGSTTRLAAESDSLGTYVVGGVRLQSCKQRVLAPNML